LCKQHDHGGQIKYNDSDLYEPSSQRQIPECAETNGTEENIRLISHSQNLSLSESLFRECT